MSETVKRLKEFIKLTWPLPEINSFPFLVLVAFKEYEGRIALLEEQLENAEAIALRKL